MCILLLLNQKAAVIILVIEPPSFPPYWNNFFQLINENIHSIFHVLYVGCVACEFLFTMVIINIALSIFFLQATILREHVLGVIYTFSVSSIKLA